MIENAAVFVGKTRAFKGVNVESTVNDEGTFVIVRHRISHDELARYSVVEVAKAEMAWDIEYGDGVVRLVAQQGCGCSGQKAYRPDEGYSGRLS